jgi:thioredoxin-related protein
VTRLLHQISYIALLLAVFTTGVVLAADKSPDNFEDSPLFESLVLPDWFKVSFLDLRDDLREATSNHRGLILYFGRHDCPYCKAHLEQNWGQRDIVAYTRANFDVVAIDVLGNRQLTDFDGKEMQEKAFAIRNEAHFTPTLFLYDHTGKLALKITGFRPPYQFRAALEYVADLHHQQESFRNYLARAEPAFSFGQDALNDYAGFHSADYLLKNKMSAKSRPLLVVFERTHCHACDVLHAGPLTDPRVTSMLKNLDAVQLDMWRDTPIKTPAGKQTTSKAWADELGLSYAPTLIFFDATGKEIIRVDSVVGFYRLHGVLRYVLSGGYKEYPNYQQWRHEAGKK